MSYDDRPYPPEARSIAVDRESVQPRESVIHATMRVTEALNGQAATLDELRARLEPVVRPLQDEDKIEPSDGRPRSQPSALQEDLLTAERRILAHTRVLRDILDRLDV